jgi:hypothetical protein
MPSPAREPMRRPCYYGPRPAHQPCNPNGLRARAKNHPARLCKADHGGRRRRGPAGTRPVCSPIRAVLFFHPHIRALGWDAASKNSHLSLTGTGRGIVRPTRRRGTSCSSSHAISAAASAGRYSRTRSPRRGSAAPVIGAGHHFLLVAPSSHSTSRWRHEERTSRASNARIS